MDKKYYITTPIYYVNARPHIGHSYTEIACDSLGRFMRLSGREVFFMTGTDEHGEKIEKATIEAGFSRGEEKKFVDGIVSQFKDLWEQLDIKYDHFIRTSDDYHVNTARVCLDKLYKDGKIYKKAYKGFFCTPCETFWGESQVKDNLCPECGRAVEKLDEVNYFFKMSEYQDWLIGHINDHPDSIRPDFRKNEVLGFLKTEKLQDLCITRPKSRMDWGIEVPFDKDYVVYVWFDALINYISGAGYPHDMDRFNRIWPADTHVIGKDIIRHHAVYWIIMLHALGISLPKMVFAHGWWIMKGEKMSKSKGNVVDPVDLVSEFGLDAYRYFLLREVAFGMDGAFSYDAIVARYNSDLANDLGNLTSRTLTMAEKYFNGDIPDVKASDKLPAGCNLLKDKAMSAVSAMENLMPELDFQSCLIKIWEVIDVANKFIEDSKPWVMARENRADDLRGVIYSLCEAMRVISILIYPFMPSTALSIWHQLGMERELSTIDFSEAKVWCVLRPGQKIKKSSPMFPRIDIKLKKA